MMVLKYFGATGKNKTSISPKNSKTEMKLCMICNSSLGQIIMIKVLIVQSFCIKSLQH